MHSLINEQVIRKAGTILSLPCLITRRDKLLHLKIYEVKKEYVRYLSQYESHLFHDDGSRKYIGIILNIQNIKYFAPLSSFKEKHKKMEERVDFIKIKDYAVININNMIPIPDGQYFPLDVNKIKDPHYKFLLQSEIREINRQWKRILKNALIVYNHKLRNRNLTPLAQRSNDFLLLEKKCKEY